jgi:nitrogen fixation NifU-like protein
MTSDRRALEVLYRDAILDHNRNPRNFRALGAGRKADGYNPLCGDRLTVFVRIENGVIEEATFQGFGCAIAKASASLMTEFVKGKTVSEAETWCERVRHALTTPNQVSDTELGDLSPLTGVREFPVRVRCATLPWETLRAAAGARDEVVSTE